MPSAKERALAGEHEVRLMNTLASAFVGDPINTEVQCAHCNAFISGVHLYSILSTVFFPTAIAR